MKNNTENENNRRRHQIQNILLVILPVLLLLTLLFSAASSRHTRMRQQEEADNVPPAIVLTRDQDYRVPPGGLYEEEGYAAYDNRDGDLTKKVEVSINGDTVRYKVRDSAGNITIRFRQIPYAESAD